MEFNGSFNLFVEREIISSVRNFMHLRVYVQQNIHLLLLVNLALIREE